MSKQSVNRVLKKPRVDDADSLVVYRYLLNENLLQGRQCNTFYHSFFLRDFGVILHSTLLFRYLLGHYGPLHEAKVTPEDIRDQWKIICRFEMFNEGPVLQHYLSNEYKFWAALLKY